MRKAYQQKIGLCCAGMIGLLSIGCQSMPQWNWWRVGQRSPTDSSPVARSASVELPSVTASRAEGSAAGTLAAGGLAPPFPSSVPEVPSITSSAVPVSYPSTGYQATASLPTMDPPAARIAQNPIGTGAIPSVTPQTGPYDLGNRTTTPAAQTQPKVASSGPENGGRYGMSPASSPVGAPPVPVQLSAANPPSGYQYPQTAQPAVPDYRSAIASTTENAVPVAPMVGPRSLSVSVPNGNGLRSAVLPAEQPLPQDLSVFAAIREAPPSQTAAAVAPYRPGGTSDYQGASQAGFSVASQPGHPTTTPTVPAMPQPSDRYAAPSVIPVPARY